MPDAVSDFPEIAQIDELISRLEALITEADETPLVIEGGGRPKRAVYRIMNASMGAADRKPKAGEAVYLDSERLVLHCTKTEVVRQTVVEVAVQAEKSGRGETLAVINGKVQGLKRVRGGYDIEVAVQEVRKTRITPSQKLRECLGKADAATWNRWCQDIRDAIDLMGMDLQHVDLSGYDFCCADLSGSDLTGANLTGAILAGADISECRLDGAIVAGTDFFRCRMSRSQAGLLSLSGMPEVESVVFDT